MYEVGRIIIINVVSSFKQVNETNDTSYLEELI